MSDVKKALEGLYEAAYECGNLDNHQIDQAYVLVKAALQWQPTEKERAILAVIAMDKKMTVNQVISQALRAYQSNEYPLEDQGMLPPQPTEGKT